MYKLFFFYAIMFLTALYAFFSDAYSTGAHFVAGAFMFVLACAGLGALCGEIIDRVWRDMHRDSTPRNAHTVTPQRDAKDTVKAARYFAKHVREPLKKPTTTPEDRL